MRRVKHKSKKKPQENISISVRPARLGDLVWVFKKMRAGDKAEIEALSPAGADAFESISPQMFFDPEFHPMTGTVNGVTAFVFGHSINGNACNVWGLGTDLVTQHAWELTKYAVPYISLLSETYPGHRIQLPVMKSNRARYTWLRMLGFREFGYEFNGLVWLRLEKR